MARNGAPPVNSVHLPVWVDPAEVDKFLQGDWQPYAGEIQELERDGLVTTDRALFTYGMFVEWDARAGETSHRDFAQALPRYQGMYDEYIEVDHGSIRFRRPQRADIAERIGVGVALSTVARLVGLTDADFVMIPPQQVKALDFRHPLRALGPRFEVEVEAKGTQDGASTSGHRRDIREKKAAQSAQHRKRRRRVIRIGIIADIAHESKKSSSIELVDPPGEGDEDDLAQERFLNRLEFYRSRLALISPRGRLVTALANRIEVLRALPIGERSSLDDVPLVGPSGEVLADRPLPGSPVRLRVGRNTRAQIRLYPLESLKGTRGPVLCYVHGVSSEVAQVLTIPAMSSILELRETEKTFSVDERGLHGSVVRTLSGVVAGLAMADRWRLRAPEEEPEASRRRK